MPTPRTSRQPARLAAVLLIATAMFVSGCGSGSHHAQVASLSSPGGGAHSATTASHLGSTAGIPDPEGRPRYTLDQTSQQQTAMTDPYWNCLNKHHLHVASGPRVTAAELACRRLYPLPPWQYDPANPQARAFSGRVVTCLEGRGFHARAALTPQGPLGDYWAVDFSPSVTTASPGGTRLLQRRAAAQEVCQTRAQA